MSVGHTQVFGVYPYYYNLTSSIKLVLPIHMLPLGLFLGHNIKSWVSRILKHPSVQVYIYSLLSSDYHHSGFDQMIVNNGQSVCSKQSTGRWCWLLSQEIPGPISSSATSHSTPQIQLSASPGCQRNPSAEPSLKNVRNRKHKSTDETFSHGCHMSNAQSGVLPSLKWHSNINSSTWSGGFV